MATADRVYYQDDLVRITRSELKMNDQIYRMAFIRAARIETLPFYISADLPGWILRLSIIGVLLLLVGVATILFSWSWSPSAVLQYTIWAGLGLITLWILILSVIALFRPRTRVDVPALRFRRERWVGADVWFASMDRTYLQRLVGVMRPVFSDAAPVSVAVNSHQIQIIAQGVQVNEQVYPFDQIQRATNIAAEHTYSVVLDLGYALGLLLNFSSKLGSDRALNDLLSISGTVLLGLSFLLAALARRRWPTVALLRLTGTFGTVYPVASTDSSYISALVTAITKQLQTSRANS